MALTQHRARPVGSELVVSSWVWPPGKKWARCPFISGGFGRARVELEGTFLPKHLLLENGKAKHAQFQQVSLSLILLLLFSSVS